MTTARHIPIKPEGEPRRRTEGEVVPARFTFSRGE